MNGTGGVINLPPENISPGPMYETDKASAVPEFTEAASKFLKSAEVGTFLDNAKAVAAELLTPDDRLVDSWNLPHQLTPLHIACLAKDRVLFKAALADPQCWKIIDQCTSAIDVDELAITKDDKKMPAMNGDTPLHFALYNGWNEGALKLIHELSDAGKINNTVNNTGSSLLSLAAAYGSLDVVSELCNCLKREFSLVYFDDYLMHSTNSQSSLLHLATQQQNPKVFEYLLENQLNSSGGSTLLQLDNDGKTPADLIKEVLLDIRRVALQSDGNVKRLIYAKQLKDDQAKALEDYKSQLDRNDSYTRKYFKDLGYPDGPWQEFYMENKHEGKQAQSPETSTWTFPCNLV
ncbi:ankyrin repeat domain-containing protein [Endozoicomonas acroporae]|uniref:ankyrin repeat domain-containing protein n=1 Tax=Endozoicomonas acroporae TaxID=1701104 RepID=UPI0013D2BF81|nr:ankyrin repeat domain-containing protein [Endozoicomonas acroporae]